MKRAMRSAVVLAVLAAMTACGRSPSEPPIGPSDIDVPSLAVGQAFDVPSGASTLRIPASAAAGEFTLVVSVGAPANPQSTPAASSVPIQVRGTGVRSASGPPNPSISPLFSVAGTQRSEEGMDPGAAWERRLRNLERRELTRLVRGGGPDVGTLGATRSIAPASVPLPGSLVSYNVNTAQPCTNPDMRTGRVVSVSQRAIVVADTANPGGAGTFSDDEYRAFGQKFDELIWPTMVQNFGEPHDVDGNSRVIIFFTRAVNELTPRNQDWYVGGFFFARDLFPRTQQQGFEACVGSNFAEMFYMLVPDPQGVINGNVRLKDRELQRTNGVLAHEFQHLINASRRLYVIRAGGSNWNEETWLNEGLSHIAEELTGYADGPLMPRQNINADALRESPAAQEAFFQYQYSNVGLLARYLQSPESHTLIGPDSLQTRGAAWSFLRYAVDRRVPTASQQSFWRGLIDSNTVGVANLRSALGAEPFGWINDWLVSLYGADALPGIESRYAFPSWNLRDIYPSLTSGQGQPIYPQYPLATRSLGSGSESVTVRTGSAAYFRFGTTDGSAAEINITGGSSSSPLRLTVLRTR
jgi:hypothetical protein